MRLAAAAGLLLALLAARPAPAQAVAQLMLRPLSAKVLVRPVRNQPWHRAGHMELLRTGDSIRVEEGSAEIVFTGSGARVVVARGDRTAVAVPAATSRSGGSWMGTAVRSIIHFVTGNPSGPASDLPYSMEGPTRPARGGVMEPAGWQMMVYGGQHPYGPRMRRLQLPADLRAWTVLPTRPVIQWYVFEDSITSPSLLRVYPAGQGVGCPPAGPALLDSVLAGPSRVADALAGRLQPGEVYRVELGSGVRMEAGCIRTASLKEQEDVNATLRGLGEEYAAAAPGEDGVTLPMLEAALLAAQGYPSDALLRLEPLLLRPDAPEVAMELWFAIVAKEKLMAPGF